MACIYKKLKQIQLRTTKNTPSSNSKQRAGKPHKRIRYFRNNSEMMQAILLVRTLSISSYTVLVIYRVRIMKKPIHMYGRVLSAIHWNFTKSSAGYPVSGSSSVNPNERKNITTKRIKYFCNRFNLFHGQYLLMVTKG